MMAQKPVHAPPIRRLRRPHVKRPKTAEIKPPKLPLPLQPEPVSSPVVEEKPLCVFSFLMETPQKHGSSARCSSPHSRPCSSGVYQLITTAMIRPRASIRVVTVTPGNHSILPATAASKSASPANHLHEGPPRFLFLHKRKIRPKPSFI